MYRIILAFILVFNLSFCKKKGHEHVSPHHTNFEIPPNIEVHFADQTSVITIQESIAINHEDISLTGVMLDDKTEYRDKAGNLIFEVDYDTDGELSLKDEKGGLIWSVKQKAGEYKVSKNEDGSDFVEIKRVSDTSIKIQKKDSEITNVVIQDKKIFAEGSENKSFIPSENMFLAYGFLFLPELSPIHKLIFIAEGVHIQ